MTPRLSAMFALALLAAHLSPPRVAHAQVSSVFAYDPAQAAPSPAMSAESSAAPAAFDPHGWASSAAPPTSTIGPHRVRTADLGLGIGGAAIALVGYGASALVSSLHGSCLSQEHALYPMIGTFFSAAEVGDCITRGSGGVGVALAVLVGFVLALPSLAQLIGTLLSILSSSAATEIRGDAPHLALTASGLALRF